MPLFLLLFKEDWWRRLFPFWGQWPTEGHSESCETLSGRTRQFKSLDEVKLSSTVKVTLPIPQTIFRFSLLWHSGLSGTKLIGARLLSRSRCIPQCFPQSALVKAPLRRTIGLLLELPCHLPLKRDVFITSASLQRLGGNRVVTSFG